MMVLTEKGQKILSGMIDTKMRMLLDWTDFVEDAGMPLEVLNSFLAGKRAAVTEEQFKGLAYALGVPDGKLYGALDWGLPPGLAYPPPEGGPQEG